MWLLINSEYYLSPDVKIWLHNEQATSRMKWLKIYVDQTHRRIFVAYIILTSALQSYYTDQWICFQSKWTHLKWRRWSSNFSVLKKVSIKNHRPELYQSLIICDNHLEAFSKSSVLQKLQCRVLFPENTRLSKISQICQLQLLFLNLQTICIWNEHLVDSYLHLYHAKTCQSTESQKQTHG